MPLEQKEKLIGKNKYQYYETGNGDTTVFMLHGIAASKAFMLDLAGKLEGNYRCIMLDLPGHNGLGLDSIDSFDHYVAYTRQFIESFDQRKYFTIGYSLGGLVSLKIAEDSNSNMLGAVIWSSPVLGFNHGLSGLLKASVPVVRKVPSDLFNSVAKNEKVLEYFNQAMEFAGIYGKVPSNPWSKFKLEDAKKIIDLVEEEKFEINTPVAKLFLYDKYDPIVSSKNYEFVSKNGNIEYNQCQLLSRCGHFKNKTGFDILTAAVSDFLDKTCNVNLKSTKVESINTNSSSSAQAKM